MNIVSTHELSKAVAVEYGARYARLTLSPQNRPFDPRIDLNAGREGSIPILDAIMVFAADFVVGDGNIVITAYTKAERELPTGVFGYVNAQYGNNFVLEMNGVSRVIRVNGNLPPVSGWAVAKIAGDEVYVPADEPVHFAHGQEGGWLDDPRYVEVAAERRKKTYLYWYVTALSALLKGRNVSVGWPTRTNNATRRRAEEVLKALSAENVPQAVNELRNLRRTSSNEFYHLSQAIKDLPEEPEVKGEALAQSFLAPAENGTFDLLTLKVGDPLPVGPEGSPYTTYWSIPSTAPGVLREIIARLQDQGWIVKPHS